MNICTLDDRWKVDGNAIYTPSKDTKIEYDSVAASESGRTEDGVMHIAWVRRRIAKVHLVYPAMTAAEAEYLLNLLQGKEFTFTYPDPAFGIQTVQAYASNSDYKYYTDGFGQTMVKDVSINIIEK